MSLQRKCLIGTVSGIVTFLSACGPTAPTPDSAGDLTSGLDVVTGDLGARSTPPPSLTDTPQFSESDTRTTLTWASSAGSSSFAVYIGTDPNPPLAGRVGVANYSFTGVQPCTTYYWRVEATTPGGTVSSATKSFASPCATALPTPPSEPSPIDTIGGQPLSTQLSWRASTNAKYYEVYLGSDPNPPFIGVVTTPTFDASTYLQLNGVYRWRIVARNDVGSATSPTWSFGTADSAQVPEKPGIVSPRSGTGNMNTRLQLAWSATPRATKYEILIGDSPETMHVIGETADTAFIIRERLALKHKYFWQVAAVNGEGRTLSNVWEFSTAPQPLPPLLPKNLTPRLGKRGVSQRPTFTWSAVPDADTYMVLLGDSNAPLPRATLTENQLALTEDLEPGKTYYWRVVAANEAGLTATDVRPFVVKGRSYRDSGRNWREWSLRCNPMLTSLRDDLPEGAVPVLNSFNARFVMFQAPDDLGDGQTQVYIFDRLNSATEQVPFEGSPVSVSDDGNRIFFTSNGVYSASDINGTTDVYMYDRSSNTYDFVSGVVTGLHTRGQVSIDESKVLFAVVENKDCSIDLFMLNRDNNSYEQVNLDPGGRSAFAQWGATPISMNGELIAFTARVTNGGSQRSTIYLRDVRSRNTIDLTPDARNASLISMSVDGARLLVYVDDVVSIIETKDRKIYPIPLNSEDSHCIYDLSPDGSTVAFMGYAQVNGPDDTGETLTDVVCTVDLATGESKLISQEGGTPFPAQLYGFSGTALLISRSVGDTNKREIVFAECLD